MRADDTIVAVSSPGSMAGGGLRAIIRLSGPNAWPLAAAVTHLPANLHPGRFTPITLRPIPLPATVLLFQAPRSFTGDHLAEIHLPGSPALLRICLDALTAAGARPADPGEFSARAFFNGKIDLTQAEGIAATIHATSSRELRAASALRSGVLHHWTVGIADRLANLLAAVEAGIDFVDEEDVRFIEADALATALHQLDAAIHDTSATSIRVDRLDALPTVVFVGAPNVGKSSLINALTGHDRSIVSPIAGTTRDRLSALLHTDRGDIRLVDVPGEEPATDELQNKMMAARQAALLEADLILEIVDHPAAQLNSSAPRADYPARTAIIRNKADLLDPESLAPVSDYADWQLVSARTGFRIPALRKAIAEIVTHEQPVTGDQIVLNQRHRAVLEQVRSNLATAMNITAGDAFLRHPELVAAELRHALDSLGSITGTISPDDVLGRIFSQFCIGK